MVGYRVRCDDPKRLADAIAAVRAQMQPLPMERLKKLVQKLALTCATPKDGMTVEQRTVGLIGALEDHPGTMVEHALATWHEDHIWFPAASEVIGSFAWRLRPMRLMRQALEQALERANDPVAREAAAMPKRAGKAERLDLAAQMRALRERMQPSVVDQTEGENDENVG